MAIYDRKCNACGHQFTVHSKISEKENPKECPECSSTDGTYLISVPMYAARSDRLMGRDGANGGFKEVIQKIQQRNPGAEINQR
jgi:putative FmdB family regulatory protein